MARYVSLKWRTDGWYRFALAVVAMAVWSASLRAQQPPPPVKTMPANAAPVVPPEALGQYGKILTPGDQPAHPLKLKLPFPDVGQVKIPSPDELVMRDKLEQLAMLSDADIRTQLEKWPAWAKMSLRDQGLMLQRIQDFQDFRANVAKAKAHAMGLLTLTPPQFARFEKEYWDKRLQLDNDLAKQFAPIYKAREQKLQDDLYREFSVMNPVPIAQATKPGASVAATATNHVAMPSQPVAQAPQ